ncbi:MAG: hypothetical protein NTZ90_17435 [Proteobacteria bacterium]|nr:hypothetical protein [Pseudomonadota bacterium]
MLDLRSFRRFATTFGMLLSVAVSGCSYSVHQQYIGSMDPDARYGKGKWVSADATDFVILGFQMDTAYVNKAYAKLSHECQGRLAQITTEHVTSYNFLSYEQKIILRGLCQG